MTQLSEDPSDLHPDSQALPGALLMDESGEFLFELDSYLQRVSEFELYPASVATAAVPLAFDQSAAKTPAPTVDSRRSGAERNSVDQHQQRHRDEDILVTSNVTTFETPDPSSSDHYFQAHQTSLLASNQRHLHQLSPSTSSGTWSHNEFGESKYAQGNEERGFAARVTPLAQPQRHGEEETRYLTAPEVPKKRNQNRSRKRQRHELEQLRASVQGLQIQLETLLDGDTSDAPSSSSRKQERQNFLDEALAWKRTASIEKQQSEHAAIENAKLRALVAENLTLCESFKEACSKDGRSRASQRELGFVDLDADSESSAVLPDSEVFASLHHDLDTHYQRINTVWDECSFISFNAETKLPSKLRSDGEGNLLLEYKQSHIFPFSTDAVSRAGWKLTKGGFQSARNGELKVWRFMGNILYATVADTISIENAPDSTIKVWIALKRFIEDHRIVIVWRTKLEVERASNVQRLAETGWNVVRSLTGSESTGDLNVAPCISQTCIRATPEQNSGIPKDEFSENSLTARVVSQCHKNLSLLNQAVENILLDEALASRGGASSRSKRDNRKPESTA